MDDMNAGLQIAYTGKWPLQQQVFFLGNIIDDSEGEKINEEGKKIPCLGCEWRSIDSTAASSRISSLVPIPFCIW